MTTPTNARQTSERERLAGILDASAANPTLHKWQREQYATAAKQLRADEAEIVSLRAMLESFIRSKESRRG